MQEDKGNIRKLVRLNSGGGRKKIDAGDRTDDEVRNELYRVWSKIATKVKSSRNLVILRTSDLGPAQLVPYLGLPHHAVLLAFASKKGNISCILVTEY